MRRFAALLALVVSAAPLGLSQSAPERLACDGSYNIVRVSEIKPGMYQKFGEAVAAHAAWYKAAGAPDQIYMLRVIERNPTTHAESYSETQAMTFHIIPSTAGGPMAAHDASYDAFVAKYKESSTIKSEVMVCMPKTP